MTDDELDAIEQRANVATPGPWTVYKGQIVQGESYGEDFGPDANFFIAARTDVHALLAEVRRLRAEQAILNEWRHALKPYEAMRVTDVRDALVEVERLRAENATLVSSIHTISASHQQLKRDVLAVLGNIE
jgi:hypothetical protein